MDFDKLNKLNNMQIIQLHDELLLNEKLTCECYCNGVFKGEIMYGTACYSSSCMNSCRNKCSSNFVCRCGYNNVYRVNDAPVCYR